MRFIKKVLNTETVVIPLTLSLCFLLVFLPFLLKMLLGELSSIFHQCASGILSLCLGVLRREILPLLVLPLVVALIVFLWNVGQLLTSSPIKKKRSREGLMVVSVGAYAIVAVVLALSFFAATYFYFPAFLEDWLIVGSDRSFDELPLYSPLFILIAVLGVGVGIVSMLLPVIGWSRTGVQSSEDPSGRDE
jgi:hypothetical protein